jgi:hypothetical protein
MPHNLSFPNLITSILLVYTHYDAPFCTFLSPLHNMLSVWNTLNL